MDNIINSLSIRGRVTYLIMCFEKFVVSKYPVGNCAEADAINQALNAGARIENLHLTTIHTTKSQFGNYKESCENCRFAFKGKVKANYSGWKDED